MKWAQAQAIWGPFRDTGRAKTRGIAPSGPPDPRVDEETIERLREWHGLTREDAIARALQTT